MLRILLLSCALVVTACASSTSSGVDAAPPPPSPDAAVPDAGGPPPPAARNVRELVPGAGRLTGGGLTLDAELGHGASQKKMTGGTISAEGNAAVKP